MTIAEGTILQSVVTFRVGDEGTRVQNVYNWRVTALVDADPAFVHSDLNARINAMMTTIQTLFDTNYVKEDVKTVDLTAREIVGKGSTAAWSGTAAPTNTVPAQIAALVLAGNNSLGFTARKYLGPMSTVAFLDGVLTAPAPAFLSSYLTLWESSFAGTISGNTYQPCVPIFAGSPPVAATSKTILPDRGRVIQTARTMRRRIPGRGLS